MPRRPVPQFPRGPGRTAARTARGAILITCPRLCPEWELSALRTLMKPHTRNRLEHRTGDQRWTERDQDVAATAVAGFEKLIHPHVETHFPAHGDFHIILKLSPEAREVSLGLVWVLSRVLPDVWWTVNRLRVKDGIFYRRRRGLRLELVVATDIHLPRGKRTTLRRLVQSTLDEVQSLETSASHTIRQVNAMKVET